MTETAARQPLTTTTWADLAANHAYLSREYATAYATQLFWDDVADLGYELAERADNTLTVQQARLLASAATSTFPIILSWTTRLNREQMRIETTTAAVNVEYLGTTQVRIDYCGFSHWVQLSDIVSAEVFPTTQTYSDS